MDNKVYFTDFFEVSPTVLNKYGAFNISLINDMPLFVDPFLIFNSEKPEYKALHESIIQYLSFLRDHASQNLDKGLIDNWFCFHEVKQNWLGYSTTGNKGSGLGKEFAQALNRNLNSIFKDFGKEKVTKGSHIEKLCLIKDGVGKDNISDFTTNLIKHYLLDYTQKFAQKHIDGKYIKEHKVSKVYFNYKTESWASKSFKLPTFNNDFVLLTPRDILTKDDIWIGKSDMINDFANVAKSIENLQLRDLLNRYFSSALPRNEKEQTRKAEREAIVRTILEYPVYIDYYIKYKEENGDNAVNISDLKVSQVENVFIENAKKMMLALSKTDFYKKSTNSFEESKLRISYLKHFIEDQDGYKLLYVDKEPIGKESDLHLLFKLVCADSQYDFNAEVNNGRGPVDFKASYGKKDSTLIEFKLAKNTKLEQNLQNQVEVYKKANKTEKSLKVILFYSEIEFERVQSILKKLKLEDDKTIILIDARSKKSASNVK